MIKYPYLFLGLFFTIYLLAACENGDPKPKQIFNPNGDSELALLMREMFDDAMRMKIEVAAGKTPKVKHSFEEIFTASATEPEKVKSEIYEAVGNEYLKSVQNLKQGSKINADQLYLEVVQNCMNCHKALCPGPMVRIEKLYLD